MGLTVGLISSKASLSSVNVIWLSRRVVCEVRGLVALAAFPALDLVHYTLCAKGVSNGKEENNNASNNNTGDATA